MKIKHIAPDLLIIGQTPWFIAIMLFLFAMLFAAIGLLILSDGSIAGLIFIVFGGSMGIIAMGLFVERLQMVLDAQTRTITISTRTIFNYDWAVFSLDDLFYVVAETTNSTNLTNSSEIRQTLSRISLVLCDGVNPGGTTLHPVSEIYSTGRSAARIVSGINAWLKELRGTDVLPKSA
ncbi:hypothetical protein MNBD_ALPHA07-1717 [hydrothermal vent metagenome]|uniref:Uncharacterized protein n=1 Tax=hydrothermal vent metagenome TaxID=652676 RepID=A0A3B0RRN6_9ZZZZ